MSKQILKYPINEQTLNNANQKRKQSSFEFMIPLGL